MIRLLILLLFVLSGPMAAASSERPLMRDFLGINGHFTFKPELYAPVCRLVRNYHNITWDVAAPGDAITVPDCRNGVRWDDHLYGPLRQAGFEVDICLQFSGLGPGKDEDQSWRELWRGQEDWCRDYGAAIARTFGPTHGSGAATSIEIGNEPGAPFVDELFLPVFRSMASGIRTADPEILIVTPTVHVGEANKYAKDVRTSFADPELLELIDVINGHTYATVPRGESTSPWTRSYPEDPGIAYLKKVDELIAWRDEHDPEAQVWITEYGYDAGTPEALEQRTGWAKKLDWRGVSDRRQAQYLVRSALCFARRGVERAYLYFYNDKDQPSVHASSGLTRDFEPKPAFHAMRQLYELLGDYRFERVVAEATGERFIYAFAHATDPQRAIWVAWSPTGTRSDHEGPDQERAVEIRLADLPQLPQRVAEFALTAEPATERNWQPVGDDAITLTIDESPCYIVFGPQ